MKLPSRIIDLSSPLENETVYDPPFMRPKIAYRSNAETAPLLMELFPGLRREDLPDGEGWAIEEIALTTHNGTHMDAPIHFQSKSIDGRPMMTIDQVPLDWFFRPGVKLDFRKLPDGHVVTGRRSKPSSSASAMRSSPILVKGKRVEHLRDSVKRIAAAGTSWQDQDVRLRSVGL